MRICRLAITSHEHTLKSLDKNGERLRIRIGESERARVVYSLSLNGFIRKRMCLLVAAELMLVEYEREVL